MPTADWLIIAVVGVSALIGVIRGLLTEVLSVVFWVAAVVLSVLFGADVAARIGAGALSLVLGHLAVFIGVLVVGSLVLWALRSLLKGTGLSGTDRLLGFIFGLLRGVVLVAGGVLLLGYTPLPQSAGWQASHLLPGFTALAGWMRERLPPWAAEHNHLGAPNAAAAVLAPPAES
jgi:membrane protein required for colicin V production